MPRILPILFIAKYIIATSSQRLQAFQFVYLSSTSRQLLELRRHKFEHLRI
jgi:hypothetical protein